MDEKVGNSRVKGEPSASFHRRKRRSKEEVKKMRKKRNKHTMKKDLLRGFHVI